MGRIMELDEKTIQKIAAGEIIERPSSIIKELVENSLDANSSNIIIEIRNGGKSYIRVTDDGDGIFEEDLDIAFKRHSTSKLSNVDDLYRIMSFGFRGEALASISTVSKVQVLTKTQDDLLGTQVFVEEGQIIKKRPVGCPRGTTMIVKDIFYNIPVREKFLKSHIVESNHVGDMVYKLALGNPGISFKYIKDNKVILKTSRDNDLISNIYTLLGKDFSDNLLKIDYKSSSFNVFGYISNNTFYRGNRSHQYLYVNNRYIKNNHISNLIESRYKSIIPINRFPVFILFIYIDPSLIDINIHPTKQQIKFTNQPLIDRELDYIIDKTLKNALSIPKALFNQEKQENNIEDLPLLFEKGFLESKDITKPDHAFYSINEHNNSINKIVEEKLEHDDRSNNKEVLDGKTDYILNNVLQRIRPIGILFSTYILAEDIESNKLLIIDQHAVHERIMYEKYKEEYENEEVITQNLLTPEVIELTNAEITVVV